MPTRKSIDLDTVVVCQHSVNLCHGPWSKQGAALVGGIHTEVVCTDYENCLFVLLTQYQKMGSLIRVQRDVVRDDASGMPTFSTNVLFGNDEEMFHVLARSLAEKIGGHKPILFGLALRDVSFPMLKAIELFAMEHIKT